MNKTMMWIVGAVVLVIVGGGLFIANQQSQNAEQVKMAEEKAAMMKKDDPSAVRRSSPQAGSGQEGVMEKDGNKMKSNDRYVEYSKANLDQASSNRRVLFFFANWCPTCRPTDADLSANKSKIPEDVTVIRVNYNDTDTDQEEKDLAKQYGVTYQHTFVQIDEQGKQVTKWNGGKLDELLANIK